MGEITAVPNCWWRSTWSYHKRGVNSSLNTTSGTSQLTIYCYTWVSVRRRSFYLRRLREALTHNIMSCWHHTWTKTLVLSLCSANTSRTVFLETEYSHKLLKIKLDVALLNLSFLFQFLKSHYIIIVSSTCLTRRVRQEHLVLICVHEIGKNFVSKSTFSLQAQLLSAIITQLLKVRSHLGTTSARWFLGTFSSFFLPFSLLLLLDCIILDLVHLLFDLVHAETFLERVRLCGEGIQLFLKFLDVSFGVSLPEHSDQSLHIDLKLLVPMEFFSIFLWKTRELLRIHCLNRSFR